MISTAGVMNDEREVSNCCHDHLIMEVASEYDWIELNLNDLSTFPIDFFTNENIELETISGAKTWVYTNHDRLGIMEQLKWGRKYRYKLKPLESIRITRDQWKEICSNCLTSHEEDKNMMWDGHKVEIID
jgi:hypothetical protein